MTTTVKEMLLPYCKKCGAKAKEPVASLNEVNVWQCPECRKFWDVRYRRAVVVIADADAQGRISFPSVTLRNDDVLLVRGKVAGIFRGPQRVGGVSVEISDN